MDSYVLNASGVSKKFVRRLYEWSTAPTRPPVRTNRIRVYRLQGILYDAGWIPSWFRPHLANFDDDMLEGRELRYTAWALAIMWFAIAQFRGEDENAPCPHPNRTLFQDFASVGLTKKVAGRLSWVFTPLINNCYTTDQLVIQGFEHVLEGLEIAGERVSSLPFRCKKF